MSLGLSLAFSVSLLVSCMVSISLAHSLLICLSRWLFLSLSSPHLLLDSCIASFLLTHCLSPSFSIFLFFSICLSLSLWVSLSRSLCLSVSRYLHLYLFLTHVSFLFVSCILSINLQPFHQTGKELRSQMNPCLSLLVISARHLDRGRLDPSSGSGRESGRGLLNSWPAVGNRNFISFSSQREASSPKFAYQLSIASHV